MSKPLFSESDLKRIETAVTAAEKKTSGEIVPYFVEASDAYVDAFWKLLGFTLIISLLLTAFIFEYSGWWFTFGIFEILTAITGGAILLCFLLVKIDPVLRFAAGRKSIQDRITSRAAEAFVSEEVFATRDRTGILIFISELEHRVLVIGDSGINAKVKPEVWTEVAGLVINGIKTGKPTDGIVAAIEKCGEILETAGVAIKSDDTNEIGNELRIGK